MEKVDTVEHSRGFGSGVVMSARDQSNSSPSCPLPPAPGSDALKLLDDVNRLSLKQMRYFWRREEDAIASSDITKERGWWVTNVVDGNKP